MQTTESQNKKVLKHLVTGRKITAAQAVKLYGIYRLSGRIYDLKKKGVQIHSRIKYHKENKSIHWSEYSI